jgi:hypothetical protein
MPMTEWERIERTLRNMQSLCQHLAETISIIEEKMKNANFVLEGETYALVEPSGSLDKPEAWVPRQGQRTLTCCRRSRAEPFVQPRRSHSG